MTSQVQDDVVRQLTNGWDKYIQAVKTSAASKSNFILIWFCNFHIRLALPDGSYDRGSQAPVKRFVYNKLQQFLFGNFVCALTAERVKIPPMYE